VTDVLGLPDDNDVRLRDGLVAGSEPILAEVYDVYSPVVYGMALHVTRDRGAAEDIAQEVFVDLWQRPERYDPERAPLRSWLSMIARRRAIDWIRRRDAQQRVRLAITEPPPTLLEDDVLAATAYKQVRKAVADLPTLHRQAILLAYFRGLTYREVARVLNIPEGTAKWRLRNALRRIGEQLKAEGFEDRLNLE
jgi:RNA polymerase sigma-70 factor (ECF subfamily)